MRLLAWVIARRSTKCSAPTVLGQGLELLVPPPQLLVLVVQLEQLILQVSNLPLQTLFIFLQVLVLLLERLHGSLQFEHL